MADQLQLYFSSLDGANVSHIAGNASDKVKAFVADLSIYYRVNHPELKATFCDYIIPRIKVTEVSVLNNAEEPLKAEGRVVCSLTVEEDMVNASKNLHGGCSSFLVDMDVCSTLALSALSLETTGKPHYTVSQLISVVYHSPATLGDELRIVNTSLTLGSRAVSAKTEIYNATHHRLVVSGTHIKMQASPQKSKL
ncbi:hypothetical protein Moror_12841 [Moniliophthora roreri MCA 2997]|uniref:Uncharacterized protein n=1 Tax=Moniliophthora roreri (strain MCA 2997) TaxID=1381753 RepID=V2XML0_MONRO|nr:hypothetical protein Moror_12841 [Moniliophthora roreri MCA 2997]KAI3611767.1 hypothetical protein WG66_007735 [Moniliophthora roreri]